MNQVQLRRMQAEPSRREVTLADELFAALDGQNVATQGLGWRVEVWGIHSAHGRYWLQCRLGGVQRIAGTFVIDPSRPRQVLQFLSDWAATIADRRDARCIA